jgi:hypothetical protein
VAAPDPAELSGDAERFAREEEVSREFGAYRAEWMDERLFELFCEPRYLGSLMAAQPMVLQGGRGTGKTTVLKGLSFRGVYARAGDDAEAVSSASFIGLYYKVMMSQVAPFRGEEVSQERWNRLFSHYVNLIHCGLIADYLQWRAGRDEALELEPEALAEVAECLALGEPADTAALLAAIARAHRRFEVFINNVAGEEAPPLSMLGAPQRAFAEAVLRAADLEEKQFCFLIDEYENLSDYQQRIFNTLIKESGGGIIYKLGVREEGWRERQTLSESQRLEEPQDFRRIDITHELGRADAFSQFAAEVCQLRLARLAQSTPAAIAELMPELSEEAEAELLGLDALLASRGKEFRRCTKDRAHRAQLEELSPLHRYALLEWAEAHGLALCDVVGEFFEHERAWGERFKNYKHTLLYTIRAGRPGLRKYYAGWETHCLLAAGNIRYLLQLIETSLRLHLSEDRLLDEPVTPATQTRAAQEVGEKNLFELESSSGMGDQLLRLLLGLGRVFGQLAAGGSRHTPETNQFQLSQSVPAEERPDEGERERLRLILTNAVMNSALIRIAANKPQGVSDIADQLFIVHPIFSPFFVFSYRRKRKMTLRPRQLLELIDDPSTTIRPLIAADSGERGEELAAGAEDLPDQMQLFAEYYRVA